MRVNKRKLEGEPRSKGQPKEGLRANQGSEGQPKNKTKKRRGGRGVDSESTEAGGPIKGRLTVNQRREEGQSKEG